MHQIDPNGILNPQNQEIEQHRLELVQKFAAIREEIDKTSKDLNDFKQQ